LAIDSPDTATTIGVSTMLPTQRCDETERYADHNRKRRANNLQRCHPFGDWS
jgi:hypothetical protein